MQAREQRHLGRIPQIFLPLFHELHRFGELLGIGVLLLLQNREMPDRFVKLEVFLRRHRLRADFTKALQIIRILTVDNDRRVPRRFVDDIRCRRVFDVIDLAHVARDHQDAIRLELHERRRWNEPIHRDAAPADLAKDFVHFLDPRNPIERNSGVEQSLEIKFVGVFAQEKNVLPHDEAPDGVIDRRVFVVALVDRELEQMLRQRGHGLIIHRDRIGFHKQ